jgi:hypothetical protein
MNPISPIVRFYQGDGTDSRGRTLADIQNLDHARMEYYHDFIQWMFPLAEPSRYNPDAPVLTEVDIAAFRSRPELREHLRRSFERFLDFLGLEYLDGSVVEAERRPDRSKLFSIPNHNWLRITRVLLCLKTLGLDEECHAFFAHLEAVYRRKIGVTADTFGYWQNAALGKTRE